MPMLRGLVIQEISKYQHAVMRAMIQRGLPALFVNKVLREALELMGEQPVDKSDNNEAKPPLTP